MRSVKRAWHSGRTPNPTPSTLNLHTHAGSPHNRRDRSSEHQVPLGWLYEALHVRGPPRRPSSQVPYLHPHLCPKVFLVFCFPLGPDEHHSSLGEKPYVGYTQAFHSPPQRYCQEHQQGWRTDRDHTLSRYCAEHREDRLNPKP